MKKFRLFIATLCLMSAMLCGTASAALNTKLPGSSALKVGSMLGDGSLPMVISLAALAIAVVALGAAVAANKKKNGKKPEDEE